ncbi:LysM peptidoglycan-binding domain-containing protein [Candidatus Uabimicrobium sp. HlEnr_7]|uniref:LysM peptidoglycan-binding domain-containing protein n=1 Tax=Candidatus Uabimicrobium helgolandensis TaxID=3095367 RepID=UPI0035574DDC
MFLTRKRIILICSIIVVYGATIVVDFFYEKKSIVLDNTKSTLPQNDSDIIQTSLSQPPLVEKELSGEIAKKENVTFDITKENKKIFLALSTQETKIDKKNISFPEDILVSDKTETEEGTNFSNEEIEAEETDFSNEETEIAKETTFSDEEIIEEDVLVNEEDVSIDNKTEAKDEIVLFETGLSQQFHIVTFGDSLWKISKKYYNKNTYKDIQKGVFALAGANPQIINIDKLNVDSQIFIPLASNVNLYYKKYLYDVQLSKEIKSSKTISKVE